MHAIGPAQGATILYMDRHLVHEVTSLQAFEGVEVAGRKPWWGTSPEMVVSFGDIRVASAVA